MIAYLDEHEDARLTCEEIKRRGGDVISHAGDIAPRQVCQELIDKVQLMWPRPMCIWQVPTRPMSVARCCTLTAVR